MDAGGKLIAVIGDEVNVPCVRLDGYFPGRPVAWLDRVCGGLPNGGSSCVALRSNDSPLTPSFLATPGLQSGQQKNTQTISRTP